MSQHRSSAQVRRLLTAAASATIGIVGAIALLGEYGHRQITCAHRNDFRDDPANWGLGSAEEIDLRSRDGLRLHSWLFRAPDVTATVIILHGHGGNKHTSLPLAQMLYPRYNVMLLDHRGHGESEGIRTTIGYEERLDVHAAVDLLLARDLGPVGIFGTSMGGVTAIMAAAEDARIAAVVADSPYARLRWAVGQVARLRGYPAFLTSALAYLSCLTTSLHLRYRMVDFDPVEVIDRIAPRPILIMHGVEDELVPVASAHALSERAGETCELWLIDGLKHCRALEEAYEPFKARMVGFFDRWLAPAAQPKDASALTSSGAVD